MRKLIVCLLVLSMLLPYAAFGAEEETNVISEAAYEAVEAMWQQLYSAEKRGVTDTENMQNVAAKVERNELYVDDSLRWNGEDSFTFETTVGVTCGYSARLRNIARNAKRDEAAMQEPEMQTVRYATRGQAALDVYLIEPYYGIDSDFTKQYQKEALSIAQATGGSYHLYSRESATIDAVAEAIEEGAVVIFDSHGETDYARGDDYTSGALTSYILLQSGTGLTAADYAFDAVADTYHAVNYGTDGYGMYYYAVDGTCIANHMNKAAPNSLLWMAICLGMATDGMHAPLREKGVEVAYGYSQSVTFYYDYQWEEVFFSDLKAGKTVAAAVADMKTEVGQWDMIDEYPSLFWAKRSDCAFPIVVSSQDAYPGHGNVDDLQTVYSTWTLSQAQWPSEESTEPSEESTEPSEESTEPSEESTEPSEESTEPSEESTEPSEESTEPSEESTEPSEESTEPSEESTEPSEESTEPSEESTEPSEESTEPSEESTEPSEESTKPSEESTEPSEESTEPSEESAEPSEEITEPTEKPEEELLEYKEFADVKSGSWYYSNVVFAYTHGLMNGVGQNMFDPNGKVTRAMLVTILYRNENEPEVDGMHNPFEDNRPNEWYTDAVIWAAKHEIVKGMSKSTFEPNTAITREQVAAILYRYAKYTQKNVDAYSANNYASYDDVDTVSAYAVAPMKWTVGVGIIGGMDGKLAPTQTATRAQIAAMLQRYLLL